MITMLGSMQGGEDSWLIALNARDRADYALYKVFCILNDISADTVGLLRIWAGLNEYGRENVLAVAQEYEVVPEYTHSNIIPFPLNDLGVGDD